MSTNKIQDISVISVVSREPEKASDVSEKIDQNCNFAKKEQIDQSYVNKVVEKEPFMIRLIDEFCVNNFHKYLQPLIGRVDLGDEFEIDFANEEKYYGETLKRALKKENEGYAYAKKVRGLFNASNVWDAITWKWTSYLDADAGLVEVNLRNQKENELTNVGLLSALIFTVAFEQIARVANGQADDNFEMDFFGYLYIIGWTTAWSGFLFSTIWAVFLGVAINETANATELKRFLRVCDKLTHGFGSVFHIQTMFLGIVGFVVGVIALTLKQFPADVTTFLVFFIIALVFMLMIFALLMFSSLRHARTMSAMLCNPYREVSDRHDSEINSSCCGDSDHETLKTQKPCSLNEEQIQKYLVTFIKNEYGDDINKIDADSDEFLQFIQTYSINEGSKIDSEFEPPKFTENHQTKRKSFVDELHYTEKKLVKRSGQRLNKITIMRAKQYFDYYLQSNLFKVIKPEVFKVDAYLDTLNK